MGDKTREILEEIRLEKPRGFLTFRQDFQSIKEILDGGLESIEERRETRSWVRADTVYDAYTGTKDISVNTFRNALPVVAELGIIEEYYVGRRGRKKYKPWTYEPERIPEAGRLALEMEPPSISTGEGHLASLLAASGYDTV